MAEVTKIDFKGTVLNIRDADTTLVSEEAPSASVTGIDSVVASKPTFYCAALQSDPPSVTKKDRLALFGVDDFIAAGLVPVLFRKSTKNGYRGWHPYLSHEPSGRTQHDVTLVKETDLSFGSVYIVKIDGDNMINKTPNVKVNNEGESYVSHGKRQIFLNDATNQLRKGNFKAQWGIGFVREEDYPTISDGYAFDLTKLATEIVRFWVYYRWDINIITKSILT